MADIILPSASSSRGVGEDESICAMDTNRNVACEVAGLGASFRDPAGYVFREDGLVKRAITFQGRENYELLMSSGLYEALVERSLMVAHREEPGRPDPSAGIFKVIRPKPIRHLSYFYEWSFGQLRDAALLTLEIQETAMDHGMSLKDASAFNIQFRGPQPVFIDTLSFERDQPVPWVAYGQFCMHFLAPLALMAHVSLDFGRFLRAALDGIPLGFASKLLPRSTCLSPGLLVHLHLHARTQAKYAVVRNARREKLAQHLAPDRKRAIVASLAGAVRKLKLPGVRTEWIAYYEQASHYSPQAESFKKQAVGSLIDRMRPSLVYDLGGNVGDYARLVTARNIDCVCYDIDPLCVHENYLRSRKAGDAHMLPLLMDLTNPSPALGFGLEERLGFLDRSRPDLVMALALMHHLRITGNIPLARIAGFLARLAPRLLIEFVPKDDPMAAALIGNRPEIFNDYSLENFRRVFGEHYRTAWSADIPDTPRKLFLFEAAR